MMLNDSRHGPRAADQPRVVQLQVSRYTRALPRGRDPLQFLVGLHVEGTPVAWQRNATLTRDDEHRLLEGIEGLRRWSGGRRPDTADRSRGGGRHRFHAPRRVPGRRRPRAAPGPRSNGVAVGHRRDDPAPAVGDDARRRRPVARQRAVRSDHHDPAADAVGPRPRRRGPDGAHPRGREPDRGSRVERERAGDDPPAA